MGENRWVRFLWFKGGVRNCMWSLKLRTQVQILPCSKSLKMLYPKYTPIKTGSYISWLSKSVLLTIRFTDEIDKDYKFYDMKLSSSLNGWIKCFDDWKLYIHKHIFCFISIFIITYIFEAIYICTAQFINRTFSHWCID